MTLPKVNSENGVALVLAVSVISLLVAITLQFNRDMRQELVSSANVLSSSKMTTMVKSGYALAEAVLQKDLVDNTFDSFHDSWSEIGSTSLNEFYGSGKLEVLISDLSGRVQLNALVDSSGKAQGEKAGLTRELLQRILQSGDVGELEEEEITLILEAITDWIDKDDQEVGIEETESSYYFSLSPSYDCRNGPLEFLEEILLIRGITEQLYYGTDEHVGLRDLVTVHGSDGNVNINSAPKAVLKGLHNLMSDELAEKMVTFRQDEENKDVLQNISWPVSSVNQWDSNVVFDAKQATTKSSYFRVLSRAENNEMVKLMTGVIHRQSPDEIVSIYRKVE